MFALIYELAEQLELVGSLDGRLQLVRHVLVAVGKQMMHLYERELPVVVKVVEQQRILLE